MTDASAVSPPARTRSTPSDLRVQWSAACSGRGADAATVSRLQSRIDESLASLEDELSHSPSPTASAALRAEMLEVREIGAGLKRLKP